MQRKFPFLGIGLLYLLAAVELLAFPLLGAGTASFEGGFKTECVNPTKARLLMLEQEKRHAFLKQMVSLVGLLGLDALLAFPYMGGRLPPF